MLKLKLIFVTSCLLSLVACKQQPRDIPTLPLAVREQILSEMQNWQAKGKIGVRYEHTGHNISFEWRQRKNKYFVYLYSPLATESAKINGSPSGATLITTDKQQYTAPTAERLIFEHLGWDLPVSHLVYWLRGLPDPNASPKIANYDQFNQLLSLQQANWRIEYQCYQAIAPVTLPEKITITNGTITVKVVISDWKK